ncbi:alpha-N-arabinofuranosidase [Streptomyces sp. ME19-01-6]|uniref:alpha-N-arabinofuranosidase n=1 Tax=Streptomyces sp. ME19-01-6 TaxID=3028686 RepID=UPI0029A04A9E|nr:alpha-L-arabinofuranosidase C-terminal domain-containing protein [Streptomyces sp. ME19-01-6]MDX3231879.1 alpha-L-arabinofuranosidase C-terminal domain-containing protein [Streptomyces sp. ME19-01-6]
MTTRQHAHLTVHPLFDVGEIDPRVFGSFVEHMGRCVYSGIYEPGHPTSDEAGFRGDVSTLIRELGVSVVRYPGGNFVSGYDWRDGIGPAADRPTRLDLAWRSLEPNLVGIDEFLPWARRNGIESMMAVNLGTAGPKEAAALVEYCNLPDGTTLARERAANGNPTPHAVRTWCLGNEMDGPWQIGHTTATEYGRRAAEAGKAMRLVDPGIELVACGSSFRHMPTFGAWEATVAELTLDVADYMSMHAYYDGTDDRRDYLASGQRLERFITDVTNTCDAVSARLGSSRRMMISLDEWNVWSSAAGASPVGEGQNHEIGHAPRITEDPYGALDAVVLGDLIIGILNHADRVKIGCLSLLVNVSAPIVTEPGGGASKQAIFHPFATAAQAARGHALRTRLSAPLFETSSHGVVPQVATAVTHDRESGRAAVFATNRGSEPVELTIDHAAFGAFDVKAARTLTAADPRDPRDLALEPLQQIHPGERVSTLLLPPESWTFAAVVARA